jgi:hypothetical protein
MGLIVGVVLGVGATLVVGPAVLLWVGRREWAEASRELELTDRLLEHLEGDPWPPGGENRVDRSPSAPPGQRRPQSTRSHTA